jgi:hypothetical protein
MLVNTLWRAINKHHHRIRALSQMSSTECCGDTNIRLYQPNLTRDGRADTQQSTPLDNTLKRICPRDHLYVWIHNTVADGTMVNNSIVDLTIEYNHACMRRPWKRRRARDSQCAQKLGRATKASQRDLDNTNMIQMNQVFANPSKEEVKDPKYTP